MNIALKSPDRSHAIVSSGYLFIAINFLIGLLSIVVGLLAGSLAITSDAIHSFIDSLSGFLIIASEKLAKRHNLASRRARIERVTTIIIAIIILIASIHIFVESIEKIITPETPDYSAATIIILVIGLILKYLLAAHLKKIGQKVDSDVLKASGAETMNDAWISIAVLVSSLIYLIWQVDIEAYISLTIAIIIFKIGLTFIFSEDS